VDRLRTNANVIGLVVYGDRRLDDVPGDGDFDIVAVVENKTTEVESIHFYVNGIAVDLNIRTLDDMAVSANMSPCDVALAAPIESAHRIQVIYDRFGLVERRLQKLKREWEIMCSAPTEDSIAKARFVHRHFLDKIRCLIGRDQTCCEFLLCSQTVWLVEHYFRLRGMAYPAEKRAIQWLRENDREAYDLLETYWTTKEVREKHKAVRELTTIVLSVVGGQWREDELITFGNPSNQGQLSKEGASVFRMLVGSKFRGQESD